MKWVTRQRVHVNRTATAWLIRRFLDPTGEILFVEPGGGAAVQEREGAIGFDAPGARYPYKDQGCRCSFAQLVDERFAGDLSLRSRPESVPAPDFPHQPMATPETPA